MSQRVPNLQSVTTINDDGSRRYLHPADVQGRFTLARRLTALVLIAVYVGLPWIPVNGFPAVFLDVANRRFHFIGLTLAAQDLWLGFFIITGVAFGLFYVAALFGRIWCGWTCPYTVFLEHVYRRVERLIDGDSAARKKLDAAPWGPGKALRRAAKHGTYLLISLGVAHVFLSYFVSLRQLYGWMQGPPSQHLLAFGVVMFLTAGLYFSFAWFREQFCIILCPYGRLQSALTDDHTVVIGYDRKRGEPRGRVGAAGAGDCINCMRCVQVCPTGIDIRNGLQLECIGCAACVDACDAIMAKVDRAPGLVRYASFQGLDGKPTRYVRPRTVVYTAFLLVGVAVFGAALLSLKPLRVLAKRIPGQPFFVTEGAVRNQFTLRIVNKRHTAASFHVTLDAARAPAGMRMLGAESAVEVPALGEVEKTVILTMPQQHYEGAQKVRLLVRNVSGDAPVSQDVEFLGPDLRYSTLPQATP